MSKFTTITDIFVGRDYEIEVAESHLLELLTSQDSDVPKVVFISGGSGIGKSRFLKRLKIKLQSSKVNISGPIDLQVTQNKAMLSVLFSISNDLNNKMLSPFFDAYKGYFNTTDIDRQMYYVNALNAFITGVNDISKNKPVILIFDTFEALDNTKMHETLSELIARLNGRCGLAVAGKVDSLNICNVSKIPIKIIGFGKQDIAKLSELMFQSHGKKSILSQSDVEKLLNLTDGKPVLCALSIDWIIEHNNQLDYVVNLPKLSFEKAMIMCLKGLSREECLFIEIMSVVVKRFNPEIANIITGISVDECTNIITKLNRFSFIKSNDEANHVYLHDEIVNLVKMHWIVLDGNKYISAAINYYDHILGHNVTDGIRYETQLTERLYYELTFNIASGADYFDNVFMSALESYNYDLCCQLITEAEVLTDDNYISSVFIELAKAELYLQQYKPQAAIDVLIKIKEAITEGKEPVYYARMLEYFGSASINACTIAQTDLFDAIEKFKKSRELYEAHGCTSRIPKCLMELGKAYVFVGKSSDAESAFKDSLSLAKDLNNLKLAAKVLDETSKMYRLQQKVDKSMIPLQESFKIRESIKDDKNLGAYFYYLANTMRDLDNFTGAIINYGIAEKYLIDVADKFKLSELYCDKAWLYRLKEDYDEAMIYLDKAWALAQEFSFGTEYSEYYHIKYEIAMATGNALLAYDNLDVALNYAKKYSNIYIILDCLNHVAQRAYALNEIDTIPAVIEEMKSYELLGCGIKVFTGRAMMVQGDVYFDKDQYEKAYSFWKDGLTIIALYGNSRSNVELFDDILDIRKIKIQTLLSKMSIEAVEALINHWQVSGLEHDFPAVVQLCSDVIRGNNNNDDE